MLFDLAVLNAAVEVEGQIEDVAEPPSEKQESSRRRVKNWIAGLTRAARRGE